jgi:hypothetical protein
MRHCKVFFLTVALLALFIAGSALQSNALVDRQDNKSFFGKVTTITGDSTAYPNAQQRVQRMGNINMCQTNWGAVGSWARESNESAGGCFNPNPDFEVPAPSLEFPAGSGYEYLFCGGLWVGAKIDEMPYVSTGCDGWEWNFEFFPDGPPPIGAIEERSQQPGACYSTNASSDQDILATYTDSTWTQLRHPDIDPFDLRRHDPLNVKIIHRSYAWAGEDRGDFIIAEYTVKNIGDDTLGDVFVGLFLDTDITQDTEDPYGSYGPQDDITGFLHQFEFGPGDIRDVDIAWAADNDGWGEHDGGLHWDLRNVVGLKVLNVSNPEAELSYNWWHSRQLGLPYDWGPWTQENQGTWSQENCYAPGDSFFPGHALGTPGGDCSKYFMMSNGEIDYDQVYSCTWPSEHPEEGWLGSNEVCDDFADGKDIRFLLSFGPFHQLTPGDSIHFVVAYLMGENFHTDPDNGQNLPDNPDSFYAHVDFSDLVQKALVAQRLYDSLLCSPTSIEEPENNQPVDFVLSQNYPNPFNPETRIRYTIVGGDAHSVPVSLKIYNILGQSVRTLVDQPQTGGKREIVWDGKDDSGKDAASGVYFYRLKAGETVETKRMVLIR